MRKRRHNLCGSLRCWIGRLLVRLLCVYLNKRIMRMGRFFCWKKSLGVSWELLRRLWILILKRWVKLRFKWRNDVICEWGLELMKVFVLKILLAQCIYYILFKYYSCCRLSYLYILQEAVIKTLIQNYFENDT